MESKQSGIIADAVRSIASLAAIAVGLFLVFVNTPAALADALFVGSTSPSCSPSGCGPVRPRGNHG